MSRGRFRPRRIARTVWAACLCLSEPKTPVMARTIIKAIKRKIRPTTKKTPIWPQALMAAVVSNKPVRRGAKLLNEDMVRLPSRVTRMDGCAQSESWNEEYSHSSRCDELTPEDLALII